MRRALAPLFLAGLLACNHAEAPKLKAAAPPSLGNTGWTAASDPESGVSLALPPGWRVGVPKTFDAGSMLGNPGEGGDGAGSAAIQGMMNDMANQSSAKEKEKLAEMREKEGIVLHCVDGSKPIVAEEPTRFYVIRQKDAGYGSLDDAVAHEKSEAHRGMEGAAVDLPVGKAYRLQAKGRNRIGDEECHVSYVFVDGPDAYVMRFASTNAPDAILGIDRDVANTFRVTKK